jgi:hypothetical protein
VKSIATLILFTALISQTFSRSLAIADYMVNLEVYKKACINKAKPKMHCNGKCQLLKKMKKQEDKSETNSQAPKFNTSELVLSSKSFFPSIVEFSLENNPSLTPYASNFSSRYIGSIFHPPTV